MSNKSFINAIYDTKSGEVLLQHPTDTGVFVNKGHYDELLDGMKMQKNSQKETKCTYTTETTCSLWVKDPKGKGLVCAKEVEVNTCTCTGPCA